MNDRIYNLSSAVSGLAPSPVVYLHVAVFLDQSSSKYKSHAKYAFTANTLGDETFRLVNFKGQESISEHFEYELELHGNTSPDEGGELVFSDIVGRAVTVGIHCPVFDARQEQPTREDSNDWFSEALQGKGKVGRLSLFNGMVASFSMEQPGVYRLTMRPSLWKLTLTNGYCVHQQLNVRDAIAGILDKHDIKYSMAALVGSDNPAVTRKQDWLQAGETDYDFVRRLMAKAHIYYFYVSTGNTHTAVFANSAAYPDALPDGRSLRYCNTVEDELGLSQPDVITEYRIQQNLTSSAVNTVFTREEAAWESDSVAGYKSFHAHSKPIPGALPFNQYLIYQYGCSDAEVSHYADATQNSMDTASQQFSGASACPYLRCGHRFSVTQDPRQDQFPLQVLPEIEGKSFVAIQIEHQASLDGSYQNKFQAVNSYGLVTPFSIQETQQGTVLAEVVAGDRGTAPVGWQYFEKNNFDPKTNQIFDDQGTQNVLPAMGVFVRFSTGQDIFSTNDDGSLDGVKNASPVWIKLAAHMQTVPEIGSTVLITRASDQSELPEIQSIIQANGTQVIMPSGWTANTNVGSSYSTGYGDGKSIRFGLKSDANLDAAVAIISQQYDSGKFRESSYSQGASYSYSTSDKGKDGLLSQSDSFGSTYSKHHGAVSDSDTVFDNTNSTSLVTANATSNSTVAGVQKNTSTVAVGVNDSTTGMQTSTSLTGVSISSETVGVHTSSSTTLASAGVSMTGMRANASVEGVSVSSNLVGMSTSETTTGISTQVNATGSSQSVSVTGNSSHVSMTGTDTGVNLVGLSSSASLTGVSTSASLVGAHTDVSLTGLSNRISVTGDSTSVSVAGSNSDVSVSGDVTNIAMKGFSTVLEFTGGGIIGQFGGEVMNLKIAGMNLTITDMEIFCKHLMKIIKPLTLGLLYKTYQQHKKNQLVVSALAFFPLHETPTPRFLLEAAQWGRVMKVLPTGQALDEVMPKACAEAMVLGSACAPQGRAVQHMGVRFQVGGIDKHLAVYGERQWRYGVVPLFGISPAQPFVKMALDYAHSFGGAGCADNPIGQGYNGNRVTALVGENQGRMPEVEYSSDPVNCHTRHFAPAGLGPMPIDWQPRKRYAGTYDQRWLREDYPGLPPDLDWRLYNQAAVDQRQTRPFTGGEPYLLQGMHPLHPEIRGSLPTQRVRAFALGQGYEAQALRELKLIMDTVWFLPEQELGVAAYRGTLAVADSDALDISTLMLAYEAASDAPKPLAHYAQVLGLRMDSKTAGLHAFNESQLAPAMPALSADVLQAQAETARQKQQAVLDEIDNEFWTQSGMERPADHVPPQVPPPLLQTPSPQAMKSGDMDLTAMMQSAEALIEKVKHDADEQKKTLEQNLAELKKTLKEGGVEPPQVAAQPAQPSWPDVLLRAQGAEDAQTLAMMKLALASSSPSSSADTLDKLAAALQLKAKARQASPTPIAPAQVLCAELAAQLGAQVLSWVQQGQPLAGKDLAGVDLRGACLAGLDLSACLLEFADLRQADLRGCDLRGAVLTQAQLAGAQFDDAQLDEANLCASTAQGASFQRTSLRKVRAAGAQWQSVNATGSQLMSALLDDADLTDSIFDGARLEGTLMNQAVLKGSRWQGASFTKFVGWKMNAMGADFSGSRWERSAVIGSDLTHSLWRGARLIQVQANDTDWLWADLSGLRAERCSWTQSKLQESNMTGALLSACDLSRAELTGARLDAACLAQSLMMQAKMGGVSAVDTDFFQALLRKANFTGADLRQASLFEAELTEVCFNKADTRGVVMDSRRALP